MSSGFFKGEGRLEAQKKELEEEKERDLERQKQLFLEDRVEIFENNRKLQIQLSEKDIIIQNLHARINALQRDLSLVRR